MGSAMALKLILLGALCFTATAEDSLDACLKHLSDPEASPDSQNCIFDSNAILSIFSNADNLECNLCNEISDLTYDTTVLLNPHITKPTAELVSLQCVKANSAEVFELNLTDPNRDITEQFVKSAQYAFVVHGFIDHYPGSLQINNVGWMQSVIKKWAKRNVNVCAVDWGKLSLEALNYFSVAQKSTVRVADFIVDTLLRFEKNGVNISETSLAGHSLGAHIVGKVGGSLKTKGKVVGYIYGLDPAGPCFALPCTINTADRLDPSDARYVQVIDTYTLQSGLNRPRWGCREFLVNNGFIHLGAIDPVSAHLLACAIFDWSLDHDCSSIGIGKKQLVGVRADKTCDFNQLYVVPSNGWAPFCTTLLGGLLGRK